MLTSSAQLQPQVIYLRISNQTKSLSNFFPHQKFSLVKMTDVTYVAVFWSNANM